MAKKGNKKQFKPGQFKKFKNNSFKGKKQLMTLSSNTLKKCLLCANIY